MGFFIVFDDFGVGYFSLCLWLELCLDYVKIDCYFVDGIYLDIVKCEFVGFILKMVWVFCVQVIVEGIELFEEFVVFSEMGVDLV